MSNIYNKDRKEIALHNTSISLGKKFMQTQTDEDYIIWQKALKDYWEYFYSKGKKTQHEKLMDIAKAVNKLNVLQK